MYAKKYNATSQTWQPTGKLWTTKSENLTLPATINSNGTAIAAYTIKGNTIQDGTPTPDSPIMPQGCGDLETVGAKAGQYKIPISSANTTTPVYLGEVETTRRIKKLALDGTEPWYASSNKGIYYTNKSASLNPIYSLGICDRFVYHFVNSVSNLAHDEYLIDAINKFTWFRNNDIARLQDWKAWLAQQYANGTPVTVWYVLATPETAVVNEPLMKIYKYADSITSSQAGVSIPTVAGDSTISVDTTVQPSEFTATWTGWHEQVGKVFDGTDWI